MRFILIDLLALLAVGGLGATAWTIIKHKKAKSLKGQISEARQLGSQNAETLELRGELVCGVCMEAVDPTIDLFIKRGWFHQRCFDNSIE